MLSHRIREHVIGPSFLPLWHQVEKDWDLFLRLSTPSTVNLYLQIEVARRWFEAEEELIRVIPFIIPIPNQLGDFKHCDKMIMVILLITVLFLFSLWSFQDCLPVEKSQPSSDQSQWFVMEEGEPLLITITIRTLFKWLLCDKDF